MDQKSQSVVVRKIFKPGQNVFYKKHIQIVQTDRTLVKIGYKTLYIKNRIKIEFK